jgi:NAD(P)-dependent dehydrogenase (short-subunit alcohol dehydrogenase family)
MPRAADYPLESAIRQSPPLNINKAAEVTWVRDKTIVITGGASGFGAGYLKRWAAAGATVVIGDIDVEKGDRLVRDTRKETDNKNLHFFYCDVTDWQSQVQFFKDAVKVSAHGGIDTVVANAGITDPDPTIEKPEGLDSPNPPPPNLAVLDVNLKGVLYTTHLALFYLPKNPDSSPANPNCDPFQTHRDRHLLLLSSMAGIWPLPAQTLYATSKHAVVGLYRNLRSSSFMHGVRVNLICPYFIDTPIITTAGRMILAGGAVGKPDDVVEAATRFVADPRMAGRAVVVGPKLKVAQNEDGEWDLVEGEEEAGEKQAIWELYAHDFEDSELFTRNIIRIMNRVTEIRGWAGWFQDMIKAIKHGIRTRIQ